MRNFIFVLPTPGEVTLVVDEMSGVAVLTSAAVYRILILKLLHEEAVWAARAETSGWVSEPPRSAT